MFEKMGKLVDDQLQFLRLPVALLAWGYCTFVVDQLLPTCGSGAPQCGVTAAALVVVPPLCFRHSLWDAAAAAPAYSV